MTTELRVTRRLIDGAIVVSAAGDVDLTSAPDLESEVQSACAEAQPPGLVVVDLSGVTFLGSIGLSLLVNAQQRCEENSVELRVVATSRAVLRPLEVTRLDEQLRITSSLEEAVAPPATEAS
ncbi:STAS domain-containing protein [Amycolatopsis thermoflava]|uniref:Anti-sigma factor antagonist n=1 Tax=Amycolatopsis thermoflava TaxID=84480 RepID=A0A3N2H0F2_9PSEU|nr:STAS domain-containing protein [Amycolatopsis thermoflava]ROS42382.1 anti-sigma B factor antagonist [Amycolatopsis thermoflava]